VLVLCGVCCSIGVSIERVWYKDAERLLGEVI
jgi:hypothetical protein